MTSTLLHTTMILRPVHLLCLAAVLLLSGCEAAWWRPSAAAQARDFSTFADPGLESVVRIVIMPLYRDRGIGSGAAVIDSSLQRSLSEIQHFEIYYANEEQRLLLFPESPLQQNRIDPEHLRKTRERFGADAVLIGRVGHWQSFDPVAIGLTLHLVDCRDGTVLWTATGLWDSGLRATQDDIRSWYQARRGQGNQTLGGWRTVLSSPSMFTRYVSDRLAASVQAPPLPQH